MSKKLYKRLDWLETLIFDIRNSLELYCVNLLRVDQYQISYTI